MSHDICLHWLHVEWLTISVNSHHIIRARRSNSDFNGCKPQWKSASCCGALEQWAEQLFPLLLIFKTLSELARKWRWKRRWMNRRVNGVSEWVNQRVDGMCKGYPRGEGNGRLMNFETLMKIDNRTWLEKPFRCCFWLIGKSNTNQKKLEINCVNEAWFGKLDLRLFIN